MRRRAALLAAYLLPLVVVLCLHTPAGALDATSVTARAGSQASSQDVVVELDTTRLEVGPGERFSFESTVRNMGDRPLDGYVAHLNILTTDESVYVDPEDWSAERTQYLDPLDPGESATLTWTVQAVTSGPLILYVSVTSPASDSVTSSNPLDLQVGGQRVVEAGGVLPLVVWMPVGVLALLASTLVRRRRHR